MLTAIETIYRGYRSSFAAASKDRRIKLAAVK
jgi:hypothetical protein